MTLTAERTNFSVARKAMIDSQLRVSGVNEERLLTAFASVAREDFVPAEQRGHAYIDRSIPLGNGSSLPAPLVQGRLLGEAAPTKKDRVLVVSCGSDYLAALVQPLVASVDVIPAAAAVTIVKGSYDLILIDGAIERLPAALADALEEGGRIVTGLVERGATRLAAGRKVRGEVALFPLADIGMPVLTEFAAPKSWSF
ncbi:MAG: protein-L-isoaspartate O-methyltransferase [Sphingomonadales bacterium]|nr:protein-L-isoaspartate O-methyltransferase [Sphingomonadales bacterium]